MNGREAHNGDKIILIPKYDYHSKPIVGILYDAIPGNDNYNGKIAPISPNNPCANLAKCLHIDDVRAVLNKDVPNRANWNPNEAPIQKE
jgi:hypothetical protein